MNKWLIAIILLAAVLRIAFLGSHMPSLYGDEISIGYNAWSVLHTGKDEFGRFMPIQFESWGDQKNPVYIYIVALFEIIFGLSATAVRLPSALSGVLAVWLTYLLVKQLGRGPEKVALISALLLAISPWHIHISRGGYEANMALSLGLAGAYFFLKWVKAEKWTHFIYSNIAFVLAMYTYYTTKLFVPMLILLLLVWGYFAVTKNTQTYLKNAAAYLIVFGILCLPVVYLALFSNGQARFASINIFSNPEVAERVIEMRNNSLLSPTLGPLLINKPYLWLRDFLEYYVDNLSPLFWYVAGDSSLRYSMGNHGMFYLIEAPFFLFGFLALFQKNKRLFLFLLAWMLIAVFPTALVGKSYGLRSIALLPIPVIFTAYGLVSTNEYLKRFVTSNTIRNSIAGIIIVIFALNFGNWLVRYIHVYPVYGYYWYDGMQQDAVMYPLLQSKMYDHIFISKYYGKTEMYYAYYTGLDPAEYQRCSQNKVLIAGTEMVQCGKYYFGDIDTKNKGFEELGIPENSLVIGAPDAIFGTEKIIARDDKRTLFKVIK
ncbi:MAG: glycosyltransferase family 39 protein [bacterium]|nr:glycosyltransferase family 39 protein [bacterium]